MGDIDSKKIEKKRKLTKKFSSKKKTVAKPSDVNLDIVNSGNKQEIVNEGFSYSSEKLPSFSDSSEKSPTSASEDTFLATSPTSKTIETLF